jgi:galactokinase
VNEEVRSVAPGRVVLIGDHTDYVGGLVLPMAIDLHTEVTGVRGGSSISLRSEQFDEPVVVGLPVVDPSAVRPEWGRYVAGVAAEFDPPAGLTGSVRSSVPPGGGLSSSAALELAVALALGSEDDPLTLARRCQRAERVATGVPCGIMDQLCAASGIAGHALLIDCATEEATPVPLPDDVAVWVIESGQPRRLADSAYALRRAQAEAAAERLGPLRDATPTAIDSLEDETLRRRARHVRSECDRVRAFAAAIAVGDLAGAGELVTDSHRSLRDDAEVSTDTLDQLVESLLARNEVLGARLTGAGFGGTVVALCREDADLTGAGAGGRRVRAADGAHLS